MSDRLRAIDALIAEHLFGWRAEIHPDHEGTLYCHCYLGVKWQGALNFSTDPAASKQARDKAGALGFKWALAFDGMKYIAYCGKDGYAAPEGEHEGASEAESFAIALLAALQIAVPE